MNANGDARTANLLAAYAGRVVEAVEAALVAAEPDAGALLALANIADGRSVEVLRRVLRLSQPGTVHVVDRLAARGLAERVRADDDRRQVRIRLTPRGRRVADELLATRLAAAGADLAALPAPERDRLASLLEQLLGAATDGREAARRICRLCDADVCGHPERCPVTLAADAAERG